MTHDVLHGDFAAAMMDNAFLMFGLPALAVWLFVRWRQGKSVMPVPAVVVLIVAALSWTVVRNLSGFPLVPTVLDG